MQEHMTDELFSETIYTKGGEDWAEFLKAMRSGKVVRITESVFDYFLEVLPPIYMNRRGATGRRVSFGFAEGAENIVDFWSEESKWFYCQCSNTINPLA